MAYTDDWETLMNGVFGPGGRFKAAPGTPAEPRQQPNSTLNDLNAALLEQQKKLDAMLKAQSAQLKTQDTAAEAALTDSRRMLRDMENDGLLAKGTTDVKSEHLGSFEGLADEVRQTVLGQDAFVDAVVRAMRRPFVLGTEPPAARNVILLCGGTGTGRHFALEETARCMAARGLLQNDQIAALDLALYANPAAEKLFLQDLYAALHAPGEIVVFEHYESCCPSFLKTLSDLAVRGSAPLSSRYIVNRDGILVDAGTALAPGAVSRLDPCGKYLIFFSNKGRAAMADKFGAGMVSALGDVCETTAYQQADLAALAAQQLNALAQKVTARLGLTLAAGADVRDYVAAQCTPQKGAAGLSGCCDRIFRALSEYCLQTDKPLTGTVTLIAAPEGLLFRLNNAAPAPLFDLLPAAYTGALDELFACRYGRLPYRSLDFRFEHYDGASYQGHSVVNYTVSEDFTRITEFKFLTGQKDTDGTTIVKEYPFAYTGAEGEIPYYAILNEENQALYEKYRALTAGMEHFHLLGRLAEYRYYNIDAMVKRAMELADRL